MRLLDRQQFDLEVQLRLGGDGRGLPFSLIGELVGISASRVPPTFNHKAFVPALG